jgi:hypothetical protein
MVLLTCENAKKNKKKKVTIEKHINSPRSARIPGMCDVPVQNIAAARNKK